MDSGEAQTDRDRLGLLLALAQIPGGATQRLVALKLGVSKVEARRRLRAAVHDSTAHQATAMSAIGVPQRQGGTH